MTNFIPSGFELFCEFDCLITDWEFFNEELLVILKDGTVWIVAEDGSKMEVTFDD